MADRVIAAVSLGGNVGDVRAAFRYALERFAAEPGVEILTQSDVYRTAPWGVTDQPAFLNMVAVLAVTISARALLNLCLATERGQGRVRDLRWGPRTLDLDVLIYGAATISEAGLEVPHPRLAERAFVLVPLAEIAHDLKVGARTVAELLAGIDASGVERLGPL